MMLSKKLGSKAENTKFKDKFPVDVEGVTGYIHSSYNFNHQKGTCDMTVKLTTEQLSFDEQTQQAVLERAGMQLETSYMECVELSRQFLSEQRPEDIPGPNIFAAAESSAEESSESEDKKPGRRAVKTR